MTIDLTDGRTGILVIIVAITAAIALTAIVRHIVDAITTSIEERHETKRKQLDLEIQRQKNSPYSATLPAPGSNTTTTIRIVNPKPETIQQLLHNPVAVDYQPTTKSHRAMWPNGSFTPCVCPIGHHHNVEQGEH